MALKAWRAVVWFLSPEVLLAWMGKVFFGKRELRREIRRSVCAIARAEARVPILKEVFGPLEVGGAFWL